MGREAGNRQSCGQRQSPRSGQPDTHAGKTAGAHRYGNQVQLVKRDPRAIHDFQGHGNHAFGMATGHCLPGIGQDFIAVDHGHGTCRQC